MTTLNLCKKAVSALKNYVMENTMFSVDIDVSSYPVKVTFFEEARQITIEDNLADVEKTSVLQFIFYDKMTIKTQEDLRISEEVFNKLKSLAKEVNRLYLIAFFENFNNVEENIASVIHSTPGVYKFEKGNVGWDGYLHFMAFVRPQRIVEDLVASIVPEVEV